jgi:hypothetical protein
MQIGVGLSIARWMDEEDPEWSSEQRRLGTPGKVPTLEAFWTTLLQNLESKLVFLQGRAKEGVRRRCWRMV